MNYKLGIKNKIRLALWFVGITLILNSLFFIHLAEAATFFFDSAYKNIGVKGEVEISLFIDTEGQLINAMGGIISFPDDIVDVIDINDGGSIINIWLQKPKVTQEGIIFSGIIPGGFEVVHDPVESKKKPGKILTFILQSKKEGLISVTLKDELTLLNDGNGTSVNILSTPFFINVLNYQGTPIEKELLDTELPEQFFPEIVQDKDMFNGKYFLIFNTQDKDSGIDYYEISENEKKWVVSESPYILKDQSLQSIIKIKAIDKSGNERIVEIPVTYPQASRRKSYFWGIITLIGAFILFRTRKNILNKIK